MKKTVRLSVYADMVISDVAEKSVKKRLHYTLPATADRAYGIMYSREAEGQLIDLVQNNDIGGDGRGR